ncbi:TetR/AcrR family transcriptional regulator [Ramlibacter sp. H39-3-26]|nr:MULTISPECIES: TetR/AcrR family transcriptional regulator [Burkholderiales]MDF1486221.1 TetR/AcrR family transcriptional regulator [Ramlibacter sp. H39-3-26]
MKKRGRQPDPAKAQVILEAACSSFSHRGYFGTSMETIAACAHTTKATIYAKFDSKERLFAAALEELERRMPRPQDIMRCSGKDVLDDLLVIASRLLKLALHRSTLGIYRMLLLPIDHAPRLGAQFWQKIVEPYRKAMEEVLRDAHRCQSLHIIDPRLASDHFFSLVIGDPTLRCLPNAHRPMSVEARTRHVRAAVKCFVAHYRVPLAQQDEWNRLPLSPLP